MQIQLPQDYPYSPPDFLMLTPNGRFQVGAKICTSFSSFHPETWSPAYTLTTLLLSFISFFTDEDSPAQGMVYMSVAQRKDLAKKSAAWGARSGHRSNLKIFNHLLPGLQTKASLDAAVAALNGTRAPNAAGSIPEARGGKRSRLDSEGNAAPSQPSPRRRHAEPVDLSACVPVMGPKAADGNGAGGTIDLTSGQPLQPHGAPGAIKRARAAARVQAAALAGTGEGGMVAQVASASAGVVDLT